MSRLFSAELDTEHLVEGEPDVFVWLREAGYPVNIQARHPVVSEKPGTDNTGYLVHEIETYSKPPEVADAVADTTTVYVCHCSDFVYRRVPDLDEHTPTEIEPCKHVKSVDKSVNAQTDENQGTLGVIE